MLSVIIPVYNEADTIAGVIERVLSVPLDKEIVVVNDGSTDATAKALQAYENHANVRLHHSPLNEGKGAAMRIGFRLARGDIVLIQDADLENDPAEHPRLCEPILRGDADVVFGSRLQSGRRGRLASYIANRAVTALGNFLFAGHLSDIECGFKVFRIEVLRALHLRAVGFEIEPELVARVLQGGWRVVEVPVSYNPRDRRAGKKIKPADGLKAIATLLRCKLTR